MGKVDKLEGRVQRLERERARENYNKKIQFCPVCEHYTLQYLSIEWNCTTCGSQLEEGLILKGK